MKKYDGDSFISLFQGVYNPALSDNESKKEVGEACVAPENLRSAEVNYIIMMYSSFVREGDKYGKI